MKILDLSSGNRAIWYNKNHPDCTYMDIREEVNPDILCNTNNGIPGSGYNLICWDPPHVNCGKNSYMSKTYGHHTTRQIIELLEKTSITAADASTEDALMAFKWNTHDIKLSKVFKLMSKWEPLFGHLTKDGPRSQTYWVMFRKK